MADTKKNITIEELKKLLQESHFSDELKAAYLQVLDQMTEEEKAELLKIMQEAHQAELAYEEQRLKKLTKLNEALEKHLQKTLRSEADNIRHEFEKSSKQAEAGEIEAIESEINQLDTNPVTAVSSKK